MNTFKPDLPGLIVFEPKVYKDERGFFLESWNKKNYENLGLEENFVQDNLSYSQYGVLRGLHFQNPQGQGKLLSVLIGEVFDVAVDIRLGSPTFGKSYSILLSSEKKNQFYIPSGFAHGFCVTSETALFSYKCTKYYDPRTEHSLAWNDPSLEIDWPIDNPTVSDKDKKGIKLNNFDENSLPKFNL